MLKAVKTESVPTLSPDRRPLASHFGEMTTAGAEIARLQAVQAQVFDADRELAAAQEAVDAIAELEAAALRLWATTGVGPMPKPMADEREQALGRLADVQRDRDATKQASDHIEPALQSAIDRYRVLAEKTPSLQRDLLLAEARNFVGRYHRLARAVALVDGVLRGIANELVARNFVADANGVLNRRAGDREGRELRQLSQIRLGSAARVREWLDALRDDPEAALLEQRNWLNSMH